MHEYPLTKQIIEIAAEHAMKNGAAKVVAINIVIGDYSGVMADSITLYFDVISQETVCEGALLTFERVKQMLRCKVCGQYFERIPFSFVCTAIGCGGEGEPTDIGREFYVKSMEVEYE